MLTEKTLTIFTPTYNRAYILPKLYESLKVQTSFDFEWLLVDDGSSDETEKIVSEWIDKNEISIRYIKQKNAGKMSAHNRGVQETQTPLFVCVDSDDWIVSETVERIVEEWKKLSCDDRDDICGFIAYRGKNEKDPLGTEFPNDIEDTSTLSELYDNGFSGDTTIIFKKDIISQYPFPIIGKEKFITEAFIYDQIDQKYKYKLIPKVMIVCEYREDGLTRNLEKISFDNPGGYTAYFMQKANFSKNGKNKFLMYVRANCFRKKTKNLNIPVSPNNKFLFYISIPFGRILYINKARKMNKFNSSK